MDKGEFIEHLIAFNNKRGDFLPKFVNRGLDYWVYVNPVVDGLQPSIELVNDKVVLTYNQLYGDSKLTNHTYDEFIELLINDF